MRTVLERFRPGPGSPPARDILLVALAITTVVSVITAGAAAAFVHGHGPEAAAGGSPTLAAAPAAPPDRTALAGGAEVADPPASEAPGPAASVSQARPATSRVPGTKPARAAAAAGTMAPASADPLMPTPIVTTVKDGPLPVLPAILGQPFDLIGGAPLLAGVPLITSPCSNCYVTSVKVDMVFADGRQANMDSGLMLHHLVLIQPGLHDTTCAAATPIGLLGQRFFAAGNERTPGVLPPGFGYHLGSGPLAAVFDIMNTGSSLQLVFLTATVSWLPDTTPGIKPVTPVWLDENNCALSTYSIPAGPTDKMWTWNSTITGRVVTAGGHVHDDGIKTVLTNQTTGQPICTSRAGYGTKPAYMGNIESMTVCSHDSLGIVHAGDTLALDTFYNSPVPRSDVMGIMIAYVYETGDLAGGTLDAAARDPASPAGSPTGGGMAMGGMG